jgi:hypothetical protein
MRAAASTANLRRSPLLPTLALAIAVAGCATTATGGASGEPGRGRGLPSRLLPEIRGGTGRLSDLDGRLALVLIDDGTTVGLDLIEGTFREYRNRGLALAVILAPPPAQAYAVLDQARHSRASFPVLLDVDRLVVGDLGQPTWFDSDLFAQGGYGRLYLKSGLPLGNRLGPVSREMFDRIVDGQLP